ncbi:XRE family transcriptional regulator (plasmid) [Sphingomonas paeninsulae]|jgi:predicted XRE-type DNA-binding protein|uniref:XRE family transcriptional regulator n=1 Tax=Sphingomonas paeninsulae TaxID=2319844 RepID=A0A494TFT7_SPHPE|nr:XRE family transcriptional regulator [Sphingomonas paeninsulae]AYJ84701.1 XRE family transcriptional regulator [Sphingomonas paeninsulae]
MEVQTFDSVFDALADTPAEAANMKARSELLSALKVRVRSWSLSQAAAAGRLGITRPRLNDLLQGKLAKFSLDALVNLATASGLAVHIQIAEAA